MKIQNGQIYLEDVPVTLIAQTYGTPTYVYEENRIRDNFRRALNAFKKYYPNFRFFYAIKANNNLAVANILRQEGAGIDAASINEILLAQKLGLGGDNVMFSGNFLSDDDIQQGLKSGVIFNLDDISILPRVLKYGKPEFLSFRLNPGYGACEVGDFVCNGGPNAKFGVHPDQIMDAYRMAKEAGIKRFGAHMMPGSCIRDPEYFKFITGLLMDNIGKVGKELGINFEFIDLGGGLGIPYKHEDGPLDIDKAAQLVAEIFRYFVGDAGYVVGTVHSIKNSYKRIIGTDVSMHTLARPAMYGAYHHIYVNGREDEARKPVGLCGQVCENTDFWVKERMLPEGITLGDIIVVENAGAYGYAMSYQYNGRLKPAEVLVNGDRHWLIRQRETIEDLVRNVTVPDHLK